jgi:putative flippase GtrA
MFVRVRLLIADKTDKTLIQLFRYTFVGGLAFIVDFLALFLLEQYAGLHYLVANLIAFTLGLTTNYALSVLWVFDRRVLENKYAEFVIFALLGVMGLGLNEVVLYLFTGLFGLYYLVSKVIATGVTFVWNFVSRKVLLFTPSTSWEKAQNQPESLLSTPNPRCATK